MKRFLMLTLCVLSVGNIMANNISIQKVAIIDTNRTAKTVNIRFNISWENSWRDNVNWDAAWIFVKYRRPQDSVWRYRHMTMGASGNNAGSGNTSMKFAVSEDKKGAFYYRQSNGAGNIKMDSLKLIWNYGADSVTVIDSVEVKVFATEMVYVPGGNFSLGDGNGKERSSNSFQLKNAPNNFVTITDKWSPLVNTFVCNTCGSGDDAILINSGIRISGMGGIDINDDKIADNPDYPTGYRSFYSMKYPVTQGQYADMLNTLSLRDSSFSTFNNFIDTVRLKKVNTRYKRALQNLDPNFYNTPIDLQRHTISLDSIEVKYTVTRPDRAFGRASQQHYEAFSDWACMRPISELEYEKAARGPLPPMYKAYRNNNNFNNSDTTSNWSGFDWAWGNDSSFARTQNFNNTKLKFSGIENGTEFYSDYSIFKRYVDPSRNGTGPGSTIIEGGDGGSGPYRVGIFATDTSSRISSGSTYYGIMDFSKNVSQMTIGISSATGRSFTYKRNGDGYLNATGFTDSGEFYTPNSGGPALYGSTYMIKQNAISERNNGGNYIGFRSVRSAPTDN